LLLPFFQVMFKQAKLRNAPFEWVYDGLAPALLPQVLQRRKGMPLALALVAAAVARRLGIQMQLLCAPEGIQSSTASGVVE
jgi:regulator of sirC expression with transglutaminase-like and TPR domain